jgi:signal peptidase
MQRNESEIEADTPLVAPSYWRRFIGLFGSDGGAGATSEAPRPFVYRIVPFCALALLLCSAFAGWRALLLWTFSESPVVVVLSGSMEPGIHRGDILLLHNRTDPSRPLTAGDMVVYSLRDRNLPIIHRIVEVHRRISLDSNAENPSPNISVAEYFLTKGDNNFGDDRGLYSAGQKWLRRSDIVGRVIFIVPKIGMITILMNARKWLKYAIIGILSIALLFMTE